MAPIKKLSRSDRSLAETVNKASKHLKRRAKSAAKCVLNPGDRDIEKAHDPFIPFCAYHQKLIPHCQSIHFEHGYDALNTLMAAESSSSHDSTTWRMNKTKTSTPETGRISFDLTSNLTHYNNKLVSSFLLGYCHVLKVCVTFLARLCSNDALLTFTSILP